MGKRLLAAGLTILLLGSCGGGGGGSSATPINSGGTTPPAQPINQVPSFTSSDTASVLEGTTAALTIEVADEDADDTIAQSISGGADADLFELEACNASRCTSNTLSFKTAPNFESPQDADGDNDYVVTVEATDASDPVEQTITITVINAVEGRIVDAPLSGAAICIDQDEDWECDVGPPDDVDCPTVFPPVDGCFTESTGTSDTQGYYSLAEGVQFPDQELRVLSIGGTDILTQKDLPNLALIAEMPDDPTQPIAVTPLSTVVSIATDPQAVLAALGFPETVTPDQLTSIDPWALANDSTESSGEFAASADLATAIGITTAELESVADSVVTTSAQIANVIQIADSVVTDTTTSGVQSLAERAAMITSTVTKELVETIEAAVTSSGSAAAASVDLGDSTVVNEVLKETAEESATLIVAEIEAKQTAGTLDLSDTNDATVAAILQIKEAQEIVTQTGLDDDFVADITAIATEAAATNQLIATQVAIGGIQVLTTVSTATALAEVITTTTTLATQLVTDVITAETFSSQADVDTLAAGTGGFNEAVIAITVDTTTDSSTDTSTGTTTDTTTDTSTGTTTDTSTGTTTDSSTGTTTGTSTGTTTDTSTGTTTDSSTNVSVSTGSGSSTSGGSSSSDDSSSQYPTLTGLGTASEQAEDNSSQTIPISLSENTLTVGVGSAFGDGDSDTLSFDLSGDDASLFEISSTRDSDTSAKVTLKFKTAPNFESPSDADQNNVYSVTITLTDSRISKSSTTLLLIKINNVSDIAPVFSSTVAVSAAENGTLASTVTATDAEGDAISFSIAGSDAAKFSINSTTGVLTFVSAPDYETPADANEDGVYEVVVTATDGTNSQTQTLLITVTDVNETVSGVLIDGYLGGATVFQDLNNNGAYDSGEPYTTSDTLGNFSLTLQSASPDAPVRVVNSGFDIGSNEVLTAMLDISPTSSGTYVMTPLSTLAARMMSFDDGMKKGVAEKIIADALGITLSEAPSGTLFGYDPIAKLAGSDSSESTKAQPVYAANTLLMTLGNVMGGSSTHLGTSVLSAANSAMQTILDNNSLSATAALTWSDTTELTSSGHSAFLNGLAEHLTQHKAPIDAFRLKPGSIKLVDYIDGTTANSHWLYPSVSGSTMTASLPSEASLDLSNLQNVLSTQTAGVSPILQMPLNSIPDSGSSGTASITVKFYDGTDTTRSSGERTIETTASVDWSSNGNTVTITAPSQSASVVYVGTDGTTLSKTFTNNDADYLTFTDGGGTKPDNLEIKLSNYIKNHLTAVGLDPGTYFVAGSYVLEVGFSGVDIREAADSQLNKVQAGFSVAEDPGVFIYIDDVVTGEGSPRVSGNAPVEVTLSQASSSDVTVNYTTTAGTATAGTDYTTTTGFLTIAAGETSGTINVPVTNDSAAESGETFAVTLSNATNATLARTSATVSIIDNEKFVDNTNAVADVYAKGSEDIRYFIQKTLKSKLKSQTVNIGGTNKTYESILADYGSVTDLDSWLKPYVDARTPGALATLKSFTASVNTRVTSEQSGTPTANNLAVGLTKIMSGVKSIDFADIQGGTLVNNDGTFATGVTQTSFDTSVDSKVSTYATLAADTIGDPLGTDTATNFPNAAIKILTSGNDDTNGTSGSDLIATMDGTDTVNGLGGNDKILGGAGVDTFDGGDGVDHLYGFASNDSLSGGAGNDYIVGGLGDDTISGGDGDDTIEAQTGDDSISTGIGNDNVNAGLGVDTITIDGSGDKTLNGSTGTDTLVISYSGISNIASFASIGYDSSTSILTFTDSNGGTISSQAIENFTVGGVTYSFVYDGYDSRTGAQVNTGASSDISDGENNRISHAFISTDGTQVVLYTPSSGATNFTIPSMSAFQGSDTWLDSAMTITGSSAADMISDRGGMGTGSVGALTVNAGDGDDQVKIAALTSNTDTINLEAGDDIVYVGTDYATDNLDGGAGSDWIAFTYSGVSGVTYTLNSGNASNFENIGGTTSDDTLTGDSNDNKLLGGKGADTLYGGNGNDTLYGGIGELTSSGTTLSNDQNFTVGLYYNHYYQGAGNDILYGGAGNDTLYGQALDDTLDGGTGKDTYSGGTGSDTFVIRVGDGSTTLSEANVIRDFEDGTDVIGLAEGLQFSSLTIEQGSGDYADYTIVRYGTEYLFIVQTQTSSSGCCSNSTTQAGFQASNLTAADFMSTSTSAQTFTGDSANNTYVGGAGNDTFTGNGGSDVIYGHSGDDTINISNKSGSYTDVINGGSGTDTLVISYSGISNIASFASIGYDSSTSILTFTDSNGGTISSQAIENFTVGGVTYSFVYDGYDSRTGAQVNTGASSDISDGENNRISHAFISTDGTQVVLYTPSSGATNFTIPSMSAFQGSDTWLDSAMTITGSSAADMISDRGGMGTGSVGALTVNAGDGDDQVKIAALTSNTDTINLEAGDDIVYVGTDYATDNLDGGAGSDWIAFTYSGVSGVTYTLNSGNASNFENIGGTTSDDTLTGDSNDNKLLGGKGADTLYGGNGNDTLYGGIGELTSSGTTLSNDQNFTVGLYYNHYYQGAGNDILYGGAGNDTLYGQALDDTLDGGTGKDTYSGGTGSDTFVIRVGDGSTTLSEANVIRDFEDGTDVIGLAEGLQFSSLTIEQGSGDYADYTIVRYGTEYLFIVQTQTSSSGCCSNSTTQAGFQASNLTAADFMSTSTSAQTFTGDSANNTYVGGAGNDTFTGNGGSDVIYGHSGDDTINISNKSGSYTDVINGGSGTDTLVISYSGISNIASFASIGYDSSTSILTFTDSNGGTISSQAIENFTVGGVTYSFVYDGYDSRTGAQVNTGASSDISDGENNRISHAFISTDGTQVVLYTPSSGATNFTIPSMSAFQGSDTWLDSAMTITGSSAADMISDRGGMGTGSVGALTVNAGDGDDQVKIAALTSNTDTINLEAGDDIVYVGTDYATDNLDGGAGSDWIAFTYSGVSGVTYTLNSGNASNFENIGGTTSDDTLTGDSNDNKLLGGKGADTLYGGNGNDTLYGGIGELTSSGTTLSNDQNFTVGLYYNHYYQGAGNDILYGGAGNDTLYGQALDDTLDGGTGKDTYSGGTGSDTFVIRVGDGSTTLSEANVIRDFEDGTDVIGLAEGLQFSSLTIEQGSGDYADYTIVRYGTEYLFIVQTQTSSSGCCSNSTTQAGFQASNLTQADFTPI